MSFELSPEGPVREEIIRCGREQLDIAVRELSEGIQEDPVRAIHNARKAIKKERSLLRLARGAMPATQRRTENAALRAAARGLSDARDADVKIATLEKLSEHYGDALPPQTVSELREHLVKARDERQRESESPLAAAAVQELGAARLRVDEWRIRGRGFAALEEGLMDSYRRGRREHRRAGRDRSLEALHGWRKRVKDLWYHERLVGAVCGPAIVGHSEDAHRLSELLGDDHDLGVLREDLRRGPLPVSVALDAVVRVIDERRDELQAAAFALATRVYAEKPRAFRRRVRRSWQAGRWEARAVRPELHPS